MPCIPLFEAINLDDIKVMLKTGYMTLPSIRRWMNQMAPDALKGRKS